MVSKDSKPLPVFYTEPRTNLLVYLFVTFVFLYLVTPLGATFNGVIVPDTHPITFVLISVSVGVWFIAHFRRGWEWHQTAFDWVFVLWGIAFAISIIANMESVRRSLIGLWYMGAYFGAWYTLHDMLSNRGLNRKMLVDALLITGLVIIFFSLVQLSSQTTYQPPVSLLGNPNALGAVLVAIVPFALSRALSSAFRITKAIWAFYSLALIANLLLTLSRGAWLSMLTSIVVLIFAYLAHAKLLSLSALREWWNNRPQQQKIMLSISFFIALVVAVIGVLLIINSFSIRERRPELRTRLWDSALVQFMEKPITGQGLYTFGRDYGLSTSIPYDQSHAHAHSVPLNILAEMGLVGFVALIASVFAILFAIRHNWKNLSQENRPIYIGAVSALAGMSIHHLFDLPAMMPAVALVGILVLVLVCWSETSVSLEFRWGKIGYNAGMIILWGSLLGTGVWSSHIYQQYLDSMRIAFPLVDNRSDSETIADYRNTALLLDNVIAQDPLLAIYSQQQALVWGFVAETGDEEALNRAILAYERFLQLEPNHAISWANFASLYWQAGQSELAIDAISQAIALAPDYTLFRSNLAFYEGDAHRPTDIDVPKYDFNQNFGRFEFLRETLQTTFLPQVGWGSGHSS